MKYPYMQEIAVSEEKTIQFKGYNHTNRCGEDEFFDMKNITNQNYPAITPRKKRGIVSDTVYNNFFCMMSKGDNFYLQNGNNLLKNGTSVETFDIQNSVKQLVGIGSKVVAMPEGVWYDEESGESGSIHLWNESEAQVKLEICTSDGDNITYHDESYYEEHTPQDNDYMLVSINGKSVLKIYSSVTESWNEVVTTYFKITNTGGDLFDGLNKNDCVKFGMNLYDSSVPSDFKKYARKYLFPNLEENIPTMSNVYYGYFYVYSIGTDYIIVNGLLSENLTTEFTFYYIERELPEMDYVIECNNRLWGCSKDGHEIYCSKLGDVENWKTFEGLSTDSWTATVGSDGVFTGAINYMGYPIFFKEDEMIRISVATNGGHQYKTTKCRGVQKGSWKSLAILNELLLYKSVNGIVAYNGNLPSNISDCMGEVRYSNGVGGIIDNRYYISMRIDNTTKYVMFVYDASTGTWCKEDDLYVRQLALHNNELYFVDNSNKLKKIYGTDEDSIQWSAESGIISYSTDYAKYVAKIGVRIQLQLGGYADFFIAYDGGEWEHKFGVFGNHSKTYSVPIVPKRCNFFRFKISGKGNATIYQITKTVEKGSDINV